MRERGPRPTWTAALSEVTETLDVPAPYAAGWQTRVPIVEMPIYLQWLAARVRDLGGTLEAHNGELGAVFTLRLPAAP